MDRARTLFPAVVAAVAATAVLAMGGCTSSSPALTSSAATPSGPPGSLTPSATASPAPSASPTPTPTPKPVVLAGNLSIGSKGAVVLAMQQRLNALGYWVGKADGKFGGTTQQAVWALQKAAGLKPSGRTTSATWAALKAGVRPTARSKSGKQIEVDLKRDLVLFVTNGHVDFILNTSTGGGYTYVSQGQTSVAITPRGHFHTYRVIEGMHRAPLGLMYRPRYFTGGVAIHGDSSVPNHPVSHGCVRVSDAAIDWIWANNLDPIGMTVWVY